MTLDGRLAAGILLFAVSAPIPTTAQQTVSLPGQDRAVEIEPLDVYRVGSLMGAEWETFSRINRVAFDAAGNLYILDAENHRVVVVGPEGGLLREMGRQGDGPGEFRMPATLAVASDGRVAVFDIGHRSFLVFDSDGAFDRMVPVDVQDGLPGIQTFFHPNGGVVSASGQGVRVMTRGMELPSGIPVQRYALEEAGGVELLHSAWLPPRGEPGSGGRVRMGGGNVGQMRVSQPPAFTPPFNFGVLPDGRMALTDTVTYAVKVLNPDGTLRSVLTRPLEPRQVTERDRRREKERRLAALREGSGPRVSIRMSGGGGGGGQVPQEAITKMMEERVESLEFADHFPVVAGLAVDARGRLWVERTAEDPEDEGPVDLLDPEGEYLGTIPAAGPRTPDAFGPNGLVAYVEVDELEVPSVVVRRLPEEWR